MEDEGTGVSFAVTVAYGENAWQVRSFRDDFTDPQVAVDAVRNLRSEGAAFALLCVDDDYFVIVRPHPARDMFLLSDATMAVEPMKPKFQPIPSSTSAASRRIPGRRGRCRHTATVVARTTASRTKVSSRLPNSITPCTAYSAVGV